MPIKIRKSYNNITSKTRQIFKKNKDFVLKNPIVSFFSLLGILLILILVSSFLQKPGQVVKPAVIPIPVTTFKIGTAPKLNLQAQIEKSGVVQITSLMGGVVQNIYVSPGSQVTKGQWLVSMATNYQGGNALSVSRQMAQLQNKNAEDSYPEQSDLINRQRDLANLSETNFERLRDITSQSINDTNNIINLNNDIINTLQNTLNSLNASSSADPSLILATKEMMSQFMSANLQLNAASRSAQYQQDPNNPPTQIAIAQKDIALKQLDIQKRALDLNREISRLSLQLARIAEATMFPAAPFSSTVERIFVRVGQNITPGTALMTISAVTDPPLTANVYVSRDLADKVSMLEPTILTIGSKTLNLYPAYKTREATQGNLYAIIYNLPQDSYPDVTDKSFVTAQVPIGYPDSGATIPYIPLDSIYQSQEEADVYVVVGNQAQARKVVLGPVYGRFVQVIDGLHSGDVVITNRGVVSGDAVQVSN